MCSKYALLSSPREVGQGPGGHGAINFPYVILCIVHNDVQEVCGSSRLVTAPVLMFAAV